MASKKNCRRQTRRNVIPDRSGVIEFGYPVPDGHFCSMYLREISRAGLSFMLAHELPGLEIGSTLERVTVRVGRRRIRGDLVVMHVSEDQVPGSICGGLFHPLRDADIRNLNRLIDELETAPSETPREAAIV